MSAAELPAVAGAGKLSRSISAAEKPDFCIITDATGSMGAFLTSIGMTLPQIMNIAALTNAFDSIGIMSYYDYCDDPVLKWSDWKTSYAELASFASELIPTGGGDIPEAAKTAAYTALHHARKQTIVFWYTDAPPHHALVGSRNWKSEREAIGAENYDWVKLCAALRAADITVYPIINSMEWSTCSFYMWMAHATGGTCLIVPKTAGPTEIAATTVNLLLALLGAEHTFEPTTTRLIYGGRKPEQPPPTLPDEDEGNAGFMPHKKVRVGVMSQSLGVVGVAPHSALQTDLAPLIKRFTTDPMYMDTVYSVFDQLLTPQFVLSLTQNSVFGVFWRGICQRRNDPRREVLLSKISTSIAKLDVPAHKEAVQKWLDASYNRVDDVLATVAEAPSQYPALVLEGAPKWKAQQLLEISYSCSPGVLNRVTQLMGSLRVVSSPVTVDYLPLSLSDDDLFRLLPHLMARGTTVSLRPSIILACIAAMMPGFVLQDRALSFLEKHRGKWFDDGVNENFAWGFIRFILKAPAVALTPEERTRFEELRDIGGLLNNGRTNIDVSLRPYLVKASRPDLKKQCYQCKQMRSFTLMLRNGRCGLCEAGFDDENTKEPLGEDQSFFCTCRACSVKYAVVGVKLLTVRPKCHYCRAGKAAPSLTCTGCGDAYLCPALEGVGTSGQTFECPSCKASRSADIESVPAQLSILMSIPENRSVLLGEMGLSVPPEQKIFDGGLTLFTAKDIIHRSERIHVDNPALMFAERPVLNSNEVVESVRRWVGSGETELGTCSMCFDDLPKHRLRDVCGRKGCTCVCCVDCLMGWYNPGAPGTMVNPASLHCPFCKRLPTVKVLMGAQSRALEVIRAVTTFDPTYYYAWCVACNKVDKHSAKECHRDAPVITAFQCEACREALRVRQAAYARELAQGLRAPFIERPITQTCPNCGVMVEKVDGCDHITCVCDHHFCFRCGFGAKYAETVYNHMYTDCGRDDI